jgi:ankyrin repeat protein
MEEKVEIFGNSALHIAAALATPPEILIDLTRSGPSIHTLNNAGQTFLHLIRPDCHGFFGARNDVCRLLSEVNLRKFDFFQRDQNGRTSLHWLRFEQIPQSICLQISKKLVSFGIPLPNYRDNFGRRVVVRSWGVHKPDRSVCDQVNPTGESAEERNINYYEVNSRIQTVEELQTYAYHADLLKTIRASVKNPKFEDSSGRNGLHCLSEVSFDLDILVGHSSLFQLPHYKFGGSSQLERNLDSLLEAGVDPNNYNEAGETPFMAFIIHVRPGEDDDSTTRFIQRLFGAGADIHRRNHRGETPLHLAVKLGRRAAIKFLLSVGANVHAREGNGLGIVALGIGCAREAKNNPIIYA